MIFGNKTKKLFKLLIKINDIKNSIIAYDKKGVRIVTSSTTGTYVYFFDFERNMFHITYIKETVNKETNEKIKEMYEKTIGQKIIFNLIKETGSLKKFLQKIRYWLKK